MLATTLGRPCLIPRLHARVKLTTDVKRTQWNIDLMNPNHTRSIEFYTQIRYVLKRGAVIATDSDFSLLHDIVAAVIELLYDSNISSESLQIDELLVQRLPLNLRLQRWRESTPQAWKIMSDLEIAQWAPDRQNSISFQMVITIHYYRTRLLLNQPVIISALKKWILDVEPPPEYITLEIAPIIRNGYQASKAIIGVVRTVSNTDDTFLQRHAAWFLANYSGMD